MNPPKRELLAGQLARSIHCRHIYYRIVGVDQTFGLVDFEKTGTEFYDPHEIIRTSQDSFIENVSEFVEWATVPETIKPGRCYYGVRFGDIKVISIEDRTVLFTIIGSGDRIRWNLYSLCYKYALKEVRSFAPGF